jgi:hypothetical protein
MGIPNKSWPIVLKIMKCQKIKQCQGNVIRGHPTLLTYANGDLSSKGENMVKYIENGGYSIIHLLSPTCTSLDNFKSKGKKYNLFFKNLLECILNM